MFTVILMGSWAPAQAPYPGQARTLQAAQEKVRIIQADIGRLEGEAKAKLSQQPEWVQAQQAVETATRDREQARAAALNSIRLSAPYVQAKAKLAESDKVIAAGNENRATARQVGVATSDAIDARLEIVRMETEAVKKSPVYSDAELRYNAANAQMKAIWDAHKENELANNRAYRAALANAELAQNELAAAQASARLARQQMAAQQQTARPQRAAPTRSRSGGGMSRGRSGGY